MLANGTFDVLYSPLYCVSAPPTTPMITSMEQTGPGSYVLIFTVSSVGSAPLSYVLVTAEDNSGQRREFNISVNDVTLTQEGTNTRIEVTVNHLDSDKEYRFQVAAGNIYGRSPLSEKTDIVAPGKDFEILCMIPNHKQNDS